MQEELNRLLRAMRPAFSRQATYGWFVLVCVGFLLRQDDFGVSSLVRALALPAVAYHGLLHFFHSSAWSVADLMPLWWRWLAQLKLAYRRNDRIVLAGDHTKTPKDGRRMPAVATLHQDSETASKPSFFRGHHWGAVALVIQARAKFFAAPLWASIHEGTEAIAESKPPPKTVRLVHMAQRAARAMGSAAYLVLDAYFAVGPVFTTAAQERLGARPLVQILTRAKKTFVAHPPVIAPAKKKRGRPRRYGEKLKLMQIFDAPASAFQAAEANVYGRTETIRYLVLDLFWRPIKGLVRFIFVESSRGRMILMSSDLNLAPVVAVELFCRRVSIETMFDFLKNLLGGLAYHFWSRYLEPASRRPKKNSAPQASSRPAQTRITLAAIEKFVNLQFLVLGTLQIIAARFPAEVVRQSHCWLRTVSSQTPSEFVTRLALSQMLRANLSALRPDWITQLIRRAQNPSEKCGKIMIDKNAA
jgi:hypothetical protein